MRKIGHLILLFLPCLGAFAFQGSPSSSVDSLMANGQWQLATERLFAIEKEFQKKGDIQAFEQSRVNRSLCLYKLEFYDSARRLLESSELKYDLARLSKEQILGDLAVATGTGVKLAFDHYSKALEISNASQISHQVKADILVRICDLFVSQRHTRQGREYLSQLLSQTELLAEPGIFLAQYHRLLGKVIRYEGKAKVALGHYHQSKKLLTATDSLSAEELFALSELYESYSSLYAEMAILDSQFYYGKASIEALQESGLATKTGLAQASVQRAFDLQLGGQISMSESFLDNAIQVYLAVDEVENVGLGRAYILKASAIIYQYQEYNRAIELLTEAVRIYESNYGADHAEMSRPIRELGESYLNVGKPELAVTYLRRALALSLKYKDMERVYRGHFFLGEGLVAVNKPAEALDNFKAALKIYRGSGRPESFVNGYINSGMASAYAGLQQFDKADYHFGEAERILKKSFGPIDPRVANLYLQIGFYHSKKGNASEAEEYFEKTIVSNKQFMNGKAHIADHSMNIQARAGLARLLRSRFDKESKWSLIERANELHFENLEALKFLISRTNPGSDLSGLSDEYRSTYDQLISNNWLQYEARPSEARKINLFKLSENARSILLALRTNQLEQSKNLSADLKQLKLADQINYQRGLIEAANPASKEYQVLNKTLIRLNAERESLLAGSDSAHIVQRLHPTSLALIQDSLAADQMIVEYQKLTDGYLVFLVAKNDYQVARLKIDEAALKSQILAFDESMKTDDLVGFKALSYNMYKKLIAPVAAHLKCDRLIIVPDDLLWNVHFDLLIKDPALDAGRYGELNYLVKKHSITHTYAARSVLNKPSAKAAEKSLLAFSYDQKTTAEPELATMRNESLANLPGTALEITRIKKRIKSDVFYGDQANESAFKQLASGYQVLHLAMHALVDSSNYEHAWLRFMSDQAEGKNDGKLQTYELYNIRLNADMVVLSACNSGQGKLYRGEGITGLGSAFIYAGAKSVLLSKWEVSDASSPELMDSFYENLKSGLPRDKALQQAKLTYLENANNLSENPLYWGSFYLLGDNAALILEGPEKNVWQWLIPAILLLALMAFFLMRRRSRLSLA